jgi:hypothetical protein
VSAVFQAKVPPSEQLKWCLYNTVGPPGWLNGALAALVSPIFVDRPTDWDDLVPLPRSFYAVLQFLMLELVGDFFLCVRRVASCMQPCRTQ